MAFSDFLGPNTGISNAQRKAGRIEQVRQSGRRGDTELIHASPFTKQLLKNMGGSGFTNPNTGLVEFAPAEFDEEYYLQNNPDVAAAVANGEFASAADHYTQFGQTEGRDASAPAVAAPDPVAQNWTPEDAPSTFDADWYLSQYQDVADAGVNAWDHFTTYGMDEGRVGNQLGQDIIDGTYDFDSSNYLDIHRDVAGGIADGRFKNAAQHYSLHGVNEDRPFSLEDPTTEFDPTDLETQIANLQSTIDSMSLSQPVPAQPNPNGGLDLEAIIAALQGIQAPTYDPLSYLAAQGWAYQPAYTGAMISSTAGGQGGGGRPAKYTGPAVNTNVRAPAISEARAERRGGFGNAITF